MFARRRSDQERRAMFQRMREALRRVTPKSRRELARSAVVVGVGTGVVAGGLAIARRHPGGLRLAAAGGALGAAGAGNFYEDFKRVVGQVKEKGEAKATRAAAAGYALKRTAGEAARTLGGKAAETVSHKGINWATVAVEDALRRRIEASSTRISQNLAQLTGTAQRVATEKAFARISSGREAVAAKLGAPLSAAEVEAYRSAQRELFLKLSELNAANRMLRKRVDGEMRESVATLVNRIRAQGPGAIHRASIGLIKDEDLAAVASRKASIKGNHDRQLELLKRAEMELQRR